MPTEITIEGKLKFLKLNNHSEVIFAQNGVSGYVNCIGIIKPLPEAYRQNLLNKINDMFQNKGKYIKVYSKPLYACASFDSNLIHQMLNKHGGTTWTSITTI